MKNISKIKYYTILAGALISGLASCKKDTKNGVLVGSNGTPTITSIRTVSKSVVDSTRTTTTTTYNSAGMATTTTTPNYNPVITPLDSTTVTGKLGNYYAIMGAHLGSATKITINGVNVIFNRALSSDNSIIFAIPSNVPYVQPQTNALVVTTLYGSVTYTFTTLAPPPTVTAVSEFNFTAGSQIALKGYAFSFITGIKLRNTNDVVTIVSKTDTTMIIKMPSSSVSRAVLALTYTSGSNTLVVGSGAEFINIDKAYQIFANGALQNSWTTNSWASPSGASATAPSISSGKGSFVATYPAGGWQIEGFANFYPSFTYDPTYTYLTFWVKGGVADHTLVLVGDKMKGGDNQVQNANAYTAQLIKAPKNVWTYYKIPLAPPSSTDVTKLNFWATGNTATTLRFFLQGMSGDVNETLYFDEVMFVK